MSLILTVQLSALAGIIIGGPLGIALGVYLIKRPGAIRAQRARNVVAAAKRSSARVQCVGRGMQNE